MTVVNGVEVFEKDKMAIYEAWCCSAVRKSDEGANVGYMNEAMAVVR